jgi:PAS domain S-box-containing protein
MKDSLPTSSNGEWTVAKLRAVMEATPHCLIVVNTERRIVLVNLELQRQFGYHRDELLGQPIEILIPKRFRSQQEIPWKDAFTRTHGLMERGVELHGRRKDGTEFPALISMRPVKSNGEALLCVEIRDSTNQKRKDGVLRLREERFRVALKNSRILVFNQDLGLRYTWFNTPIVWWAAHDCRGRTDAEIIGGEEGARLTSIKQGVLDSGVGTQAETTLTFAEETRYFHLTVEPLRDSRGDIIGITGAASDVTPLKLAGAERERLVAELQDALANVKLLSGLLPICASCKRIRNDRGDWVQIEVYISKHSEARFTHGVCPDCGKKLYGDQFRSR